MRVLAPWDSHSRLDRVPTFGLAETVDRETVTGLTRHSI
jgi:hypothetical protein